MDIDLFLKSSRTAHRLTQKEMARRIGVSRVHYARLENGGRIPSDELLDTIGDSLGIAAGK